MFSNALRIGNIIIRRDLILVRFTKTLPVISFAPAPNSELIKETQRTKSPDTPNTDDYADHWENLFDEFEVEKPISPPPLFPMRKPFIIKDIINLNELQASVLTKTEETNSSSPIESKKLENRSKASLDIFDFSDSLKTTIEPSPPKSPLPLITPLLDDENSRSSTSTTESSSTESSSTSTSSTSSSSNDEESMRNKETARQLTELMKSLPKESLTALAKVIGDDDDDENDEEFLMKIKQFVEKNKDHLKKKKEEKTTENITPTTPILTETKVRTLEIEKPSPFRTPPIQPKLFNTMGTSPLTSFNRTPTKIPSYFITSVNTPPVPFSFSGIYNIRSDAIGVTELPVTPVTTVKSGTEYSDKKTSDEEKMNSRRKDKSTSHKRDKESKRRSSKERKIHKERSLEKESKDRKRKYQQPTTPPSPPPRSQKSTSSRRLSISPIRRQSPGATNRRSLSPDSKRFRFRRNSSHSISPSSSRDRRIVRRRRSRSRTRSNSPSHRRPWRPPSPDHGLINGRRPHTPPLPPPPNQPSLSPTSHCRKRSYSRSRSRSWSRQRSPGRRSRSPCRRSRSPSYRFKRSRYSRNSYSRSPTPERYRHHGGSLSPSRRQRSRSPSFDRNFRNWPKTDDLFPSAAPDWAPRDIEMHSPTSGYFSANAYNHYPDAFPVHPDIFGNFPREDSPRMQMHNVEDHQMPGYGIHPDQFHHQQRYFQDPAQPAYLFNANDERYEYISAYQYPTAGTEYYENQDHMTIPIPSINNLIQIDANEPPDAPFVRKGNMVEIVPSSEIPVEKIESMGDKPLPITEEEQQKTERKTKRREARQKIREAKASRKALKRRKLAILEKLLETIDANEEENCNGTSVTESAKNVSSIIKINESTSRKSVIFSDGIMPGENSSESEDIASSEESIHSDGCSTSDNENKSMNDLIDSKNSKNKTSNGTDSNDVDTSKVYKRFIRSQLRKNRFVKKIKSSGSRQKKLFSHEAQDIPAPPIKKEDEQESSAIPCAPPSPPPTPPPTSNISIIRPQLKPSKRMEIQHQQLQQLRKSVAEQAAANQFIYFHVDPMTYFVYASPSPYPMQGPPAHPQQIKRPLPPPPIQHQPITSIVNHRYPLPPTMVPNIQPAELPTRVDMPHETDESSSSSGSSMNSNNIPNPKLHS